MERRLMFAGLLPFTASPKRTAFATASRFATGRVPGSARSTAHACVLGAAPNAVDAPENIFERVLSCAWVSSPMTISHFLLITHHSSLDAGRHPRMPVSRKLVLMGDAEHLRLGEI